MSYILRQPADGKLTLLNATVPACLLPGTLTGDGDRGRLIQVNIEIAAGKIQKLSPSTGQTSDDPMVHDLDGGMVLPALVDMHTHLDKGHIWPRKPNPDGTFDGALSAVGEDRLANWSAEDVRARMTFGLKSAYVYGTSVIRTHIDSLPPQHEISWPVFKEVRSEWAGKIELQGSCLFGIDRLDVEPNYLNSIADCVADAGGVLGSVTYMVPELDEKLDEIFQAAEARGLNLDFHVDETKDPEARTLEAIARAAIRNRFGGQVVCGHCCSLARQEPDEIERTLDLVGEARLGIVSLPMCNMYLQDREAGRTPRWRGVTLLHEMKARGIDVAVSSDNTRDPFYAYGDLDLVEVYSQATRILQLDHPIDDWVTSVSTAPAKMLGVDAGYLSENKAADLILFNMRNWSEFFARPRAAREVLRNGVSLREELPDYRELDHLMMTKSGVA